MKQLATRPVRLQKPRPTLLTPGAKEGRDAVRSPEARPSGSTHCACGGREEPRTSSYWRPLPKTCGNWPSPSPFRCPYSPNEAKASNRPPRSSLQPLSALVGRGVLQHNLQIAVIHGPRGERVKSTPLLPFEIGTVNGREGRGSGLRLKAQKRPSAVCADSRRSLHRLIWLWGRLT